MHEYTHNEIGIATNQRATLPIRPQTPNPNRDNQNEIIKQADTWTRQTMTMLGAFLREYPGNSSSFNALLACA
jgi:hypothetical protein